LQGCSVEKTPQLWMRPLPPIGFPLSEQIAVLKAQQEFHQRLDSLPEEKPDVAAATFLEPHSRWNGLINAVSTYVSGAELDHVSARDFGRYADSGVNWRVVEGYGTGIASPGHNLPVMLAFPVRAIDQRGRRLTAET